MPWSDLASTTAALVLVAIPLALSVAALLDATRRPQWAWALADRNQALWIALVLVGVLSVIGGLVVSATYLLRVRPVVAAAEQGQVPVPRRRRVAPGSGRVSRRPGDG